MACRGEVVGAAHLFAQAAAGEQLRQLGQHLQVQVGGLFRYQQHEQQIYRLAVRRLERNRRFQAHEETGGFLQALDTAMRNGHALAQAGGTQLLAGEQAVEHVAARNAEAVLNQEANLFEQALLAGDFQVGQNMGQGKYFADQAHDVCGGRKTSAILR